MIYDIVVKYHKLDTKYIIEINKLSYQMDCLPIWIKNYFKPFEAQLDIFLPTRYLIIRINAFLLLFLNISLDCVFTR